jgi:hypothetical protein
MAPTKSDWNKFEVLSESAPSSITWASRGGDGVGKSYFGATAPGPLFVCGFDPHGMSRVSAEVRRGKEFKIGRYGFKVTTTDGTAAGAIKMARPIWGKFVEDYHEALKYCKTILWDREDLAWELLRYAEFGDQKNSGSKTGAFDYGDLNAEYVSLIQEAKDAGVHLGLLQGLRDNWLAKFDSVKGKMVNYCIGDKPDGFKKVADHVDITLDHKWDDKQKEYVTTFRKFPNKDFKDMEIANLTFTQMAMAAYPDTTESDWGG